MITLYDKNHLVITGLDSKHKEKIKEYLTIPNPAYYRALGKRSVYNIPKEYRYYEERTDAFVVQKGFAAKMLKSLNMEHEYVREKIVKKRSESLLSKIKLRPYQEPIVQCMDTGKSGIIELSTGGGKTIVSLYHAALSGLTVTIIVKDKKELHQFVASCEEFLSYRPGIIGDGKKIIKDITIATAQTLKRDRALLARLAAHTSILFVDECHEYVSDLSMEILSEFSPDQMYGLTGTPRRSDDDGRTKAIGFIFGEILVRHRVEDMKPNVRVYATGADIPVVTRGKTVLYNKMIDHMISNEARNKFIAGMVMGEVMSGRKVLLLVNRVAHAETLKELLPAAHLVQANTKQRGDLLRGMKTGDVPYVCIIGTYKLLGTGTDIPTLDTLINAGDSKSNVLTEQFCGRVLRLMKNKEPRVIDVMDERNGILKNQFRCRKQVYKKLGWPIEYYHLDKSYRAIRDIKKNIWK